MPLPGGDERERGPPRRTRSLDVPRPTGDGAALPGVGVIPHGLPPPYMLANQMAPAPVSPSIMERMPSFGSSWGQGLTIDPSRGGLALRSSSGVPPLSPSPHTPGGARGRGNLSPSQQNPYQASEERGYDGSQGLLGGGFGGGAATPRQPPRATQQASMAGMAGMAGMPGMAYQGMPGGDVGWAQGRERGPNLSRTTSAPPNFGNAVLLGEYIDLGAYRNTSETSTPDLSPSRSPASIGSAGMSPERERRPTLGLPRTKLSRTSSCPPLGDVDEDSELLSTESDGEDSVHGEAGSSGQEEFRGRGARPKRKRPIPLPGAGLHKGKGSQSRDSQRTLNGSDRGQAYEHNRKDIMEESKDEDETEEYEGDDLSPDGREKEKSSSAGRKSGSRDEKPKTEAEAEAPKDYIHVRARRGQATDSHSLAERVRREKISERMKVLQDLVPTCNKVTGKALMLDEIINYVRSLQLQVELLSSKLAAIDHEALVEDELRASGQKGPGDVKPQMPPGNEAALLQHLQQQHEGAGNGGLSPAALAGLPGGVAGLPSLPELRALAALGFPVFEGLAGGHFRPGDSNNVPAALAEGAPGLHLPGLPNGVTEDDLVQLGLGGLGAVGGVRVGAGGGDLGSNGMDLRMADSLSELLGRSTRGMEGLAVTPFSAAEVSGQLPGSWDGGFPNMANGGFEGQLPAASRNSGQQGVFIKAEP